MQTMTIDNLKGVNEELKVSSMMNRVETFPARESLGLTEIFFFPLPACSERSPSLPPVSKAPKTSSKVPRTSNVRARPSQVSSPTLRVPRRIS